MFKKYLILLCVLAFMLVGCGQNKDAESQDVVAEESENTDLDIPDEDVVPDPDDIPETKTSVLKVGKEVEGNNFDFMIAGIEEYDKIETDRYTDKPEKGKKFLVVYLAFQNNSKETIYIPADGMEAEVDGEKVETTYLVNDPNDYSPIFQNVIPNDYITGYVVWEVPSDWEEFTFTYSGIDLTCQDVITATITPDMLFQPEEVEFDR